MAFDVDGVMTDGALHFLDSGEEIKVFNVLDGHGVKMLAESGVQLAIVSARRSRAVERRAQSLGIGHLYQGAENKLETLTVLARSRNLALSDCGFMGDDLLDLPALGRVGFAASVPNAPSFVRERVHYVANVPGGRGAVREVCEFIMRAQGTLDAALQAALR
jgi:3-deoxy-D-manno-octulosonate 8-phosphate phosphatase (KDO 8-P phosphatase)